MRTSTRSPPLKLWPKILAVFIGAFLAVLTMYPSSQSQSASRQLRQAQDAFYGKGDNVHEGVEKETEDIIAARRDEEPSFRFKGQANRGLVVSNKDSESDSNEPENHNNGKNPQEAKDTKAVKSKEAEAEKQVKNVESSKETVQENFIDKSSNQKDVINPHPYKVVVENPDLCKVDNLLLVVMLHTEADRYKRRAIIRQTWGNPKNYPGTNIRLLFLMGNLTSLPLLQKGVIHEAETSKDILQEDFEESSKKTTDKTVGGLRWISKHCQNAQYVMKADDKMFINMFTVVNHLTLLQKSGFVQNLLMGLVWSKMHVQREGNFAIPKEAYPYDLYPPFCSSFAYIMSKDVVLTLHETAYHVKYFWVEDVFVTGMVSKAAGINVTSMNPAYVAKFEIEELFSHKTEWHKYAFSFLQDWDTDLFLRTWKKLVNVQKENTIPVPDKVQPGRLATNYVDKVKLVKNPEAPYNQKKKS